MQLVAGVTVLNKTLLVLVKGEALLKFTYNETDSTFTESGKTNFGYESTMT